MGDVPWRTKLPLGSWGIPGSNEQCGVLNWEGTSMDVCPCSTLCPWMVTSVLDLSLRA